MISICNSSYTYPIQDLCSDKIAVFKKGHYKYSPVLCIRTFVGIPFNYIPHCTASKELPSCLQYVPKINN